MKNIILILILSTFCLGDQRHFVWTYEYKTVNRGEVEFEHYYTTSYLNSSNLSDAAIVGHELELEIGTEKSEKL